MTPYELGKIAAYKQALGPLLPLLGAGVKAVLPYAAMIAGPWAFDKLTGGGTPSAEPTASQPNLVPNVDRRGAKALAESTTRYDPNAQFGGLSPAMGQWAQKMQLQRGMNKAHFQQLHAPRW